MVNRIAEGSAVSVIVKVPVVDVVIVVAVPAKAVDGDTLNPDNVAEIPTGRVKVNVPAVVTVGVLEPMDKATGVPVTTPVLLASVHPEAGVAR